MKQVCYGLFHTPAEDSSTLKVACNDNIAEVAARFGDKAADRNRRLQEICDSRP